MPPLKEELEATKHNGCVVPGHECGCSELAKLQPQIELQRPFNGVQLTPRETREA